MRVAIDAARLGGRIAAEGLSRKKQVREKGRGNVVTDVDVRAEKEITLFLSKAYPGFNFLAEEGTVTSIGSDYCWIIDPLDGTRNYASGLPVFCCNVALAKDGEVVLGVTYDPLRDELFQAEEGSGAFLNGEPIHVGDRLTVQESFVGVDLGYEDRRGEQALDLMKSIWPGVQGFRVIGSAALGLAYAAAGRFDLYFHNFLYPWDFASSIILIREAGGVITEHDGSPVSLKSTALVAGNAAVHADFMRLAAGYPVG